MSALAVVVVVGIVAVISVGFMLSSTVSQPLRAPVRVHGWVPVFTDNFDGTSLDTRSWGAYSGEPSGDPNAWWDPSHVVVHDGIVSLETYQDPRFANRWVSGGMSSSYALKQQYGKYLVRLRMDKGTGIAMIALLWPSADVWPPEIDFAENGGGDRRHNTATLHYTDVDGDRRLQRRLAVDLTKWHVFGVEWMPHRLRYTIDGHVWATVHSPRVPDIPMELDAQAQALACNDPATPCPNGSTPPHVDFQIDWVAAYRKA